MEYKIFSNKMARAVGITIISSSSLSLSLAAATTTTLTGRGKVFVVLNKTLASNSFSSTKRKLIMYSKPGCCLCDGLKDKLHAAFSLSSPDPLHDVQLLVRDITTNPEWERAYQYEIPVLARLLPDGTEEILPRLSPRLRVELVQKKIATALRE